MQWRENLCVLKLLEWMPPPSHYNSRSIKFFLLDANPHIEI